MAIHTKHLQAKYFKSLLKILIVLSIFFIPLSPVKAQVACTVSVSGSVYPSSVVSVVVSSSSSLEGYSIENASGTQKQTINDVNGQQTFRLSNDTPAGTLLQFIVYDAAGNPVCLSPSVTVVPWPTMSVQPNATNTPFPEIVNEKFLLEVNPLTFTGNKSSSQAQNFIDGVINLVRFNSPASFMNQLMPYLFSLAGLILFVMILWGGFEMLYGAADSKAQEAGKQRITAALIGFTLLFISYWIAQILQFIFGVNILG